MDDDVIIIRHHHGSQDQIPTPVTGTQPDFLVLLNAVNTTSLSIPQASMLTALIAYCS